MTSNASSSTSSSSSTAPVQEEVRPQAGPLPSKQGEIGYREELHGQNLQGGSAEGDNRSIVVPLPARHPEDRDAHDEAHTDVPLTPAMATSLTSQPVGIPSDASSTHSSMGKRSIISFLKPCNVPTYGGIRLTTLLLFISQTSILCGTIAAWVLVVMHINAQTKKSNAQAGNNGMSSSIIFVHVVFAVAFLAQLIFFERRLFRLRAERYSFLHPGEMLPTSRRQSTDTNMGFAPWSRPPLPTYAAALAQNGHGTGDVEDNIIAIPPPPAYGNTRNSRLLLQGFLRNSLRAQRPVSVHSQMSQTSQSGERPLSYVSQDSQWQEIQDAARARKLEETLSRLEEGTNGDPATIN